MAIIKTYPLKNNYYGPDRLILSDMQPDDQGVVHGTTKSLTLSNLKSFIGGGAATLQLTTNFTSGAATFDVNTNILNIPDYSVGNVDGSGTAGKLPLWTDSNTIGNSNVTQNALNIGIGTTNPVKLLDVEGDVTFGSGNKFVTGINVLEGLGPNGVSLRSGVSSALFPSFSNSSDTNTGMFLPGLDVLGLSTGGNERLRVTSAGNVGIGTTAPGYKLDIDGDVRGNSFWFRTNTASAPASTGGFYRPSLGDVAYGYNAIELFRITSSGSVGIGTASPTSKLNIVDSNSNYSISGDSSGNVYNISSTGDLRFRANGGSTQAFIINNNLISTNKTAYFASNVGIGTTAPAAKLDILDTVNQTAIRVTNNQYNNYLIQKRRTDNSQVLGIKEFGSIGGLALVTGGSERLNITNLGRVDINGDGSTNAGKLRLNCSANTHSVEIVGPDHSGGSSYSLKLPNSLPSVSNQILEANALGVLSWIPTPSGGGGGGGTVTSVGLSAPPAFSVGNSPITGSGNISLGVTGGTAGEFLAYNGQWATPTDTNSTYSLGTGSTAGQIILTGSNPTTSQTVTVGGSNGISMTQFTSGTFQVNLDLATSSTRGGIELFSNNTQTTAANSVTTTASRTYGIQLNAANQAVVNVPWVGGGTGSPAGVAKNVQFNDGTSFSADVNFNWDSSLNKLILGKDSAPQYQEGILRLLGDGQGGAAGTIEFQSASGKSGGAAASVKLQGPVSGVTQEILLPDSLPTSNTQILGIDTIVGTKVTTQWETPTSGGSSKLGFSPSSIYQATHEVTSEDTGRSVWRASVVETDCTIDKVDFFVTSVTNAVDLTVAVYVGYMTSASRVLIGTSSALVTGINTVTFATSYTFSAGDNIIIYTSQEGGEGSSTIAGQSVLNNAYMIRQELAYSSTPASSISAPLTTGDRVLALHFYDE